MIAYYSRVSTTEQAENGHSISEQIDRMEKYCDAMGWNARQSYTDPGFSGANIDRPAMQKLIKDVKAGMIEKVVVYKLDRLSRSQKDTLYLIEDVFLANGCDFVSMSENFDTSTPFGRAMIGILAVFAQLEREQIKERMAMGWAARAKQGKFHGSCHDPIGYDYINGELIVNEFEKMQIIQIFNDYASGMNAKRIAAKLNDAGYNHKYGKWYDKTIRYILSSKIYIGYIKHSKKWYKGIQEPIISEELFNQVQRITEKKLQDYRLTGHKAGVPTSYLGGMCYCAKCGSKYGKKKYNNKYIYYSCYSRSRPESTAAKAKSCDNALWYMDELDNLVFEQVRKLTLEDYEPTPVVDNTEPIKKGLSDISQRLEKLIDLYSMGNIPKDALQAKIKALNEQREKLEIELEKAQENKLTESDAIQTALSLDDALKYGTFENVRAILTTLIDRIIIDGDEITIYWNFA